MKLKITLNQYLDLVKIKFFSLEQGEVLFNNFMTNERKEFPNVTKDQLKILRKMGCVKIA